MFVHSWAATGIAQTSVPGNVQVLSNEMSLADTPSQQETQTSAVQDPVKPGNIVGTILDQSGTVAVGAAVRLTIENKSFTQKVTSGDNGQYSFSDVPPGHFNISVN